MLKYITCSHSDYHPLLLKLVPDRPVLTGQCPFRFLAAWIEHLRFEDFVQDTWRTHESKLGGTIVSFSSEAKFWNLHVFGHIVTGRSGVKHDWMGFMSSTIG